MIWWLHIWLLLINCETWIMTLRVRDLQSDSDLDSIRNSCDVFDKTIVKMVKTKKKKKHFLLLFFLGGNKFGGCIFSGSLSEWAWQAQSRCGARQKNQTESQNCDFEGPIFYPFLKKDTNHGLVAWWDINIYMHVLSFSINTLSLVWERIWSIKQKASSWCLGWYKSVFFLKENNSMLAVVWKGCKV